MTTLSTRTLARLAVAALPLLLVACGNDAQEVQPESAVSAATPISEQESAAPAAPVEAPSLAEALESGQADLTFFYVPSSGFAYRNDDGRLTGVTVELLRDFARHVQEIHDLRVHVTWVGEERWADFYGYVRDSRGGVFGIGNVTITEARGEELDFSPPYMQNIAVLVTHESVPELGAMEEIGAAFSDLVALRYPGTLHETRLEGIRDEHFPAMRFQPVTSNDDLVSTLAAGPETFGYIDIYNFWRAREAGEPLRRHPVGDDAAETFGVILPNGSDWTPVMTEFFEAIGGAEGARVGALLREHLGDELAALLSGG